MKKMSIILLTLFLMFSLTSCKSASDVASEKLAEKGASEMLGGDVDVDIDGDTVTVTGKDGNEVVMGGTEWPADKIGGEIPELKKGTITYTANSDTDCMISVDELADDDFQDYLNTVTQAGFTENSVVSTYDTGVFYTAVNSKGITIQLAYDNAVNELIITVSQNQSSDQ